MNTSLLSVLLAMVPAVALLWGSVIVARTEKTFGSFLQLGGAGCFVVVILTHVCEVTGIFPSMQWGLKHSAGHYLDLTSAILGLILFPVGFLLVALKGRQK